MATLKQLRRTERAALLDTLEARGPDAPTLCTGWTAADVAAHLVMAERYLGLPMAVLYPLRKALPEAPRGALMARLRRVGDRQTATVRLRGWDWTLGRLRSGPPGPYDWPWVAPIRLVEEWIHHEDVRRGSGAGPRPADEELDGALWRSLQVLSGFAEFSTGRHAIEVVRPDGVTLRPRLVAPDVSLTGPVGELLLFLAGRCDVARVEVEGDPTAMREVRQGLTV